MSGRCCHSDVILESRDGKHMPAHFCIIRDRAPGFFEKYVFPVCGEDIPEFGQLIKVPDADIHSLKFFMRCVYTHDEVPIGLDLPQGEKSTGYGAQQSLTGRSMSVDVDVSSDYLSSGRNSASGEYTGVGVSGGGSHTFGGRQRRKWHQQNPLSPSSENNAFSDSVQGGPMMIAGGGYTQFQPHHANMAPPFSPGQRGFTQIRRAQSNIISTGQMSNSVPSPTKPTRGSIFGIMGSATDSPLHYNTKQLQQQQQQIVTDSDYFTASGRIPRGGSHFVRPSSHVGPVYSVGLPMVNDDMMMYGSDSTNSNVRFRHPKTDLETNVREPYFVQSHRRSGLGDAIATGRATARGSGVYQNFDADICLSETTSANGTPMTTSQSSDVFGGIANPNNAAGGAMLSSGEGVSALNDPRRMTSFAAMQASGDSAIDDSPESSDNLYGEMGGIALVDSFTEDATSGQQHHQPKVLEVSDEMMASVDIVHHQQQQPPVADLSASESDMERRSSRDEIMVCKFVTENMTEAAPPAAGEEQLFVPDSESNKDIFPIFGEGERKGVVGTGINQGPMEPIVEYKEDIISPIMQRSDHMARGSTFSLDNLAGDYFHTGSATDTEERRSRPTWFSSQDHLSRKFRSHDIASPSGPDSPSADESDRTITSRSDFESKKYLLFGLAAGGFTKPSQSTGGFLAVGDEFEGKPFLVDSNLDEFSSDEEDETSSERRRVLLDQQNADVLFQAADGIVLGHRSVLCGCSPWFTEKLQSSTVTTTDAVCSPVLSLTNYDSIVLLEALKCVYAGCHRSIPPELDVLKFLGIARLWQLEKMERLAIWQIRKRYCHQFHKPCNGCVNGVLECLPTLRRHDADDLMKDACRWIARYFTKIWQRKAFCMLHADIHTQCYSALIKELSASNVLDVVIACEKLHMQLSRQKYSEPVLRMISGLLDVVAEYTADHFDLVLSTDRFLTLARTPYWNVSALEDVLTSAIHFLNPEMTCKCFTRLDFLLNWFNALMRHPSERFDQDELNQRFIGMVKRLYEMCDSRLLHYAASVMKCDGWQLLTPAMQARIRESGIFVEFRRPCAPMPKLSSANRVFAKRSSSTGPSRHSTGSSSFSTTTLPLKRDRSMSGQRRRTTQVVAEHLPNRASAMGDIIETITPRRASISEVLPVVELRKPKMQKVRPLSCHDQFAMPSGDGRYDVDDFDTESATETDSTVNEPVAVIGKPMRVLGSRMPVPRVSSRERASMRNGSPKLISRSTPSKTQVSKLSKDSTLVSSTESAGIEDSPVHHSKNSPGSSVPSSSEGSNSPGTAVTSYAVESSSPSRTRSARTAKSSIASPKLSKRVVNRSPSGSTHQSPMTGSPQRQQEATPAEQPPQQQRQSRRSRRTNSREAGPASDSNADLSSEPTGQLDPQDKSFATSSRVDEVTVADTAMLNKVQKTDPKQTNVTPIDGEQRQQRSTPPRIPLIRQVTHTKDGFGVKAASSLQHQSLPMKAGVDTAKRQPVPSSAFNKRRTHQERTKQHQQMQARLMAEQSSGTGGRKMMAQSAQSSPHTSGQSTPKRASDSPKGKQRVIVQRQHSTGNVDKAAKGLPQPVVYNTASSSVKPPGTSVSLPPDAATAGKSKIGRPISSAIPTNGSHHSGSGKMHERRQAPPSASSRHSVPVPVLTAIPSVNYNMTSPVDTPASSGSKVQLLDSGGGDSAMQQQPLHLTAKNPSSERTVSKEKRDAPQKRSGPADIVSVTSAGSQEYKAYESHTQQKQYEEKAGLPEVAVHPSKHFGGAMLESNDQVTCSANSPTPRTPGVSPRQNGKPVAQITGIPKSPGSNRRVTSSSVHSASPPPTSTVLPQVLVEPVVQHNLQATTTTNEQQKRPEPSPRGIAKKPE